jgi:Serine dehydrogenase proteinase
MPTDQILNGVLDDFTRAAGLNYPALLLDATSIMMSIIFVQFCFLTIQAARHWDIIEFCQHLFFGIVRISLVRVVVPNLWNWGTGLTAIGQQIGTDITGAPPNDLTPSGFFDLGGKLIHVLLRAKTRNSALGYNEIVMSPHAVLGPIDPQLGQFPAASLLKVVEQKPMAEIDDQTLILADVGRKAIDQVRKAAHELLQGRLPEARAEELSRKLCEGNWTHDYPISAVEAKNLGLNVSAEMPSDILDLLSLYPQPTRTHGGVEYLPVRRQPPATRPANGDR